MERFDIFNARQQKKSVEQEAVPEPKQTNGFHAPKSPTPDKSSVKREAPSDTLSEATNPSPPKKQKHKTVDEDADAAFAAKLQAEENKRSRSTRGGNARKAAPVKKRTPKKKTPAKIRGSDESELDDSGAEKKPKNTGFNVGSPICLDAFG